MTRNDPHLTVCFGTTLGLLSIWRQGSKDVYEEVATTKVGKGQEILSIQADKPTLNDVRFVVGSLCGQVQLWKYDNTGSLENTFAVTIGTTIPRKVAFTPMTVSSKSKAKIMAYGLYDGQMYVFFRNHGCCQLNATQTHSRWRRRIDKDPRILLPSVSEKRRSRKLPTDYTPEGAWPCMIRIS